MGKDGRVRNSSNENIQKIPFGFLVGGVVPRFSLHFILLFCTLPTVCLLHRHRHHPR